MFKRWLIAFVFILFLNLVCAVEIDPVVSENLIVNDNINVIIEYKNDSWSSVEINEIELNRLSKDNKIETISYDYPISSFLQDSVPLLEADMVHSLQVQTVNLTGTSRTVCLIDSGINSSHSGFSNRVVYEACFCSVKQGANNSCCPNGQSFQFGGTIGDLQGHGTHVAGIIAGSTGVAPNANIVSVKVLNSTRSGLTSDVVEAINFCVSNRSVYNITVISASLGTSDLFSSACDAEAGLNLLRDAINSANLYNISTVFATGNAGSTTSIAAPACMSNATAVAASTKADAIASYSNRNAITDLVAPGSSINSTCYTGGYCTDSGTSMAAPHVAGTILLLRQYKHLFNINITNSNVESLLRNNGLNITDAGTGLNFSRVNILDTIDAADLEAPFLTLISPTNTTYNYNASILLNSSVEDINLDSTFYSLDGGANITVVGAIYFNVTLDGSHNITLFVNDTNGNINSSTILFSVNTAVPNLTLAYPQNNTNYTTNDLDLNFSTSSSAYSCIYQINNVNTSMDNCENTTLTDLAQGEINLTLFSRNFHNQSNSSSISFFIDSINPAIAYTTGTESNNSYSSTRNFIFVNVSVNDTNIGNITFELYNSTLLNSTNFSSWSGNTSINWTGLSQNSVYYYNVTVYDLYGNSNYSETRKITFDNTKPRITNISNTNSGSRVYLYVTTNENAYCAYSTSDGSYSEMTAMSTTGGTSHTKSNSFSSSSSGTYYVRCKDYTNNTMTTSNSTEYDITVSSGGRGGSGGGSSSSSDDDEEEEEEETDSEQPITKKTTNKEIEIPEAVVNTSSKYFENLTKSDLKSVKEAVFKREFKIENNKTLIILNINYTGENTTILLYEKIPKIFANTTKEIDFNDLKYIVVKEDPEVIFIFENLSKGNFTYNYSVNKNTTLYEQIEYSKPLLLQTNKTLKEDVKLEGGSIFEELTKVLTYISIAVVILIIILVLFIEKIRSKRLGSAKEGQK